MKSWTKKLAKKRSSHNSTTSDAADAVRTQSEPAMVSSARNSVDDTVVTDERRTSCDDTTAEKRYTIESILSQAESYDSSISPDTALQEEEMLVTLTGFIQKFSVSMNSLLSTMANEEKEASVRQSASLDLIEDVSHYVLETSNHAGLEHIWKIQVFPLVAELEDIVQDWDWTNTLQHTPENFTLTADMLLQAYTKSISNFINGGTGDIHEDLGDLAIPVSEDASDDIQDASEQPYRGESPGGKTTPQRHTSHYEDVDHHIGDDRNTEDQVEYRVQLTKDMTDRDDGVSLLFRNAKNVIKFQKDSGAYFEKRVQIMADCNRRLAALAKTALEGFNEEDMLGCKESWKALLTEHHEVANRHFEKLNSTTCIQPVLESRIFLEKTRKQLKETWSKETKKMADAALSLTKAKAKYLQVCQEWSKTSEGVQKEEKSTYKLKLQKRVKEEAELRSKVTDARMSYDDAVNIANLARKELLYTRGTVIADLTRATFSANHALKETFTGYQGEIEVLLERDSNEIQATKEVIESEDSQKSVYDGFTLLRKEAEHYAIPTPFEFHPYEVNDKVKAYLQGCAEINPCLNPAHQDVELSPEKKYRRVTAEQVAKRPNMHAFVRYKIPSTCRQCHRPCFFEAVTCTKCSIICHKKCTEALRVHCTVESRSGGTRLRRTHSVFDSPLGEQDSAHRLENHVPIIVRRLVAAIEERGLDNVGLFRLAGVKTHVEALCTEFEYNPTRVSTDEHDITALAAVLKLYFRQLPEPLLPDEKCNELLKIVQENRNDGTDVTERMRILLESLPLVNYKTLAFMIMHLTRVADHCEVNKMHSDNLSIVLGPTLLRIDCEDKMNTLLMLPMQQLGIKLMIENAQDIFQKFLEEEGHLETTFTSIVNDGGVITASDSPEMDHSDDSDAKEGGHEDEDEDEVSPDKCADDDFEVMTECEPEANNVEPGTGDLPTTMDKKEIENPVKVLVNDQQVPSVEVSDNESEHFDAPLESPLEFLDGSPPATPGGGTGFSIMSNENDPGEPSFTQELTHLPPPAAKLFLEQEDLDEGDEEPQYL